MSLSQKPFPTTEPDFEAKMCKKRKNVEKTYKKIVNATYKKRLKKKRNKKRLKKNVK